MTSALDLQLEGSSVTFEQLFEIQEAFDETEVEIIRHQVKLNKPIYEKRAKVVAGIPNFWPLVFEQAPPDVDEYVQPTDAALLMAALKSIHVSHFEIEGDAADPANGDPRSVSIKFEFGENDHFEDKMVEKKFWYRRAKGGSWSGLVSEPVDLKWKEGKDLTNGLLDAVKAVWDEDHKPGAAASKDRQELTASEKALAKKLEESGGSGGVSFFAWFGYRGKNVSAEESRVQTKKEKENRRLRAEGKEVPDDEDEDAEDDDDDEDEDPLEIFPGGDELAVCIVEDLWQDAVKYFLAAQEQDDGSEMDYESMDEDMEDAPTAADQPPVKKHKQKN
ncbi:hypothetical protein RB597_002165 [Gaeumannomyces tritici]